MKLAGETYTCSRCAVAQPCERFPKKGLICKACYAADAYKRYWADPAKHRAIKLRASNKWRLKNGARFRQALRTYRKNHPDRVKAYDKANRLKLARRWRKAHPIQAAAHDAVSNALKAGKLVRQPCAICQEPKSQAHHCDYAKPLEVMWLCKMHHAAWHRVFIADGMEEDSTETTEAKP